jgi:hypothetical protein
MQCIPAQGSAGTFPSKSACVAACTYWVCSFPMFQCIPNKLGNLTSEASCERSCHPGRPSKDRQAAVKRALRSEKRTASQ